MSEERVWEEAAYVAALMVYLIETKCDEADKELADLLGSKGWYHNIVFQVLETYSKAHNNPQQPPRSS